MNLVLETERLILREFTTVDTSFIIELLNSPGWLQFIGDRNIKTTEDAEQYLLNGPLKSYAANGFGLSMVLLKNGNIPIGMCGIIKRDNLENPDIGYALLPAYTRKGMGVEIAAATLQYAKKKLQLPVICAITDPANTASVKVLEKIGMKLVKSFSLPGSEEVLLLYSN